jgi:hypothetical protein
VSNRNVSMRLFVLFAALLFVASACWAQNPQADLPTKFGQWTATGQVRHAAPNFGSDEALRTVFTEAGVSQAATATYTFGTSTTKATAYAFQDSSGAYQAFTYRRSPQMVTFDVSLTHTGAFDREHALLSAGNLLVEVAPASDVSMGDLKDLLRRVVDTADKTPFPPIQTFLPREGRVPSAEHYALGPSAFRLAAGVLNRAEFASLVDQAGFASGAEAIFAPYHSGPNDAVLLLIDYPTPQLAELHLRHLQRALLASKQDASVERKGSLLSMVLAPTTPEYGEKLRSAVNYETQVTWNEPSQTATDPPWSTVLGKIFVFTGIFMVVAVVLGVAFGGVRVITKRLFPGKVFDRPHQIEVLQLGLSSKPIDPQDLY